MNYWSRDVLKFEFLEKSLEIVSTPHFAYDLSRKMFLMLFSINWPSVIAWLNLLLEILDNICIAIVSFPGCDVIIFEINLIFLHDQKVRLKILNILRKKRAFSCQKLPQTLECTFEVIILSFLSLRATTIQCIGRVADYNNVLSVSLALYFHQFENGFNQCDRNIMFWITKLL